MFTFRLFEWSDGDDFKYDECGKRTEAVLQCGYIKLPLCRECLEELKTELDKHLTPHFCRECTHYGKHRYWYDYGGTCKLKHPEITENQYGDYFCCDPFNSCGDFKESTEDAR